MKGTPMTANNPTYAEMRAREEEFRQATKGFILKRDADFKAFAETQVAKGKKIRHSGEQDPRRWRWEDAIWCGDESTDVAENLFFFDNSDGFMDVYYNSGEKINDETPVQWMERIFNEVFAETLPDLVDILEG
jgi:hypothetical protein